LTGRKLRALRRLQREQDPPSTFVFTSERGVPFVTGGFRALIARLGEADEFDFRVHPHMLRHACGYKLANDGVDTRPLQAYLGHRNIQHSVRYTELAEAMRSAISRCVAIEGTRGWHIGKQKQSHKIDVVIALAMACHAAVQGQNDSLYSVDAFQPDFIDLDIDAAARTPTAAQQASERSADYVRAFAAMQGLFVRQTRMTSGEQQCQPRLHQALLLQRTPHHCG
jgi:hypothetical protein